MLGAVMIAGMTGCSNESPAGTDTSSTINAAPEEESVREAEEAAPGEVETLEVLMYADWYTDGWKALESYIHENAATLGFDIELSTMEGGDQGDSVWQVKFATDDLPDLGVFYTPQWIQAKCNGLDKIVDLTGIESAAEYDSSVLDAYSMDGKLYAMPINTSIIVGMWYNKDVMEACGIEELPTNYDELKEVCETVKNAGYLPIYFSGGDTWSLGPALESAVGADAQELSGGAKEFTAAIGNHEKLWTDCANTLDALAFWKEMIKSGYVNETYMADTFENSQDALANGECAMCPMGTWVIDNIMTKYPDKVDSIGAFPLPSKTGENWVNMHMPYSLAVTTNCRNVELGKKAVDWIASSEAQQIYADAQPGLYLNKNIVLNEVPTSTMELYEAAQKSNKLTNDWQEIVKYSFGNFQQYVADYYIGSDDDPVCVMEAMDAETRRNAEAAEDPAWN